MKAGLLLLCFQAALFVPLGGCVAVKQQLIDPNVAARYDSAKSPEAFARCASAALPEFRLEQTGVAWALVRKQGIVLLSRWDFFPTNSGSQAELRNGANDAAGVDKVLACA